jgi:hypothetical protein
MFGRCGVRRIGQQFEREPQMSGSDLTHRSLRDRIIRLGLTAPHYRVEPIHHQRRLPCDLENRMAQFQYNTKPECCQVGL